jgi:hypothetical protein
VAATLTFGPIFGAEPALADAAPTARIAIPAVDAVKKRARNCPSLVCVSRTPRWTPS